ncbi:hypothetical protein DFA_02478 [Cavenderia fasciculata]|uniref:NIF3-like protein 1 n=1 Tax=Cavenderia fasciculata TaxID=261658 RepID=F4Q059_CACFS|nr:uncharacterized protein DFA_02478 [Cavenderia fasciculata]EGG18739.1 hypothetical protein DFA_02478 [Cavenderia fasciculata]|eukprot:XP_004357201.1 hypothetical protein DFA_02478 [Cavenderia fasciculata]
MITRLINRNNNNLISTLSILKFNNNRINNKLQTLYYSTTTTTTTMTSPNFKQIVSTLNSITPLELAGSWDNVGVLVEPSTASSTLIVDRIFLTNDLTEPVLDEAINAKCNMIISYHPPLFSQFKRITQQVTSQRIAIKAIENQIPIYSPHSSLDAINGGINDWIARSLLNHYLTNDNSSASPTNSTIKPIQPSQLPSSSSSSSDSHKLTINFKLALLSEESQKAKVSMISQLSNIYEGLRVSDYVIEITTSENKLAQLVRIIDSNSSIVESWNCNQLVLKFSNDLVGQGRIVTFDGQGLTIDQAIDCVKKLFDLKYVRLGRPLNGKEKRIKSIALCAGSGASVILSSKVDLYLTGELSHHEILEACAKGNYVIVCDHSNTERGYLKEYKTLLESKLNQPNLEIIISKLDSDPLSIV